METRVKHKGKYYRIEVECVYEKTRESWLSVGDWKKVPDMCKFYESFGTMCKHAYSSRLRFKPLKCHCRARKTSQIRDVEIAEVLERI